MELAIGFCAMIKFFHYFEAVISGIVEEKAGVFRDSHILSASELTNSLQMFESVRSRV